jgi:hypothetical protein
MGAYRSKTGDLTDVPPEVAEMAPNITQQIHRLLRVYGPALIPVLLAAAYLWLVAPEVDARLGGEVTALCAVALLLLWPRDRQSLARVAGELRALGRRIDAVGEDVVGPLADYATRSGYTVKLVQGSIERLDGKLNELILKVDEAKAEMAEAMTDAYRKGLVAGAQGVAEPEERTLSVINGGDNGGRSSRFR